MHINMSMFVDEFGNLLKEFEVIQYEKLSTGEWVESSRIASGRTYFEIEGKLYNKLGSSSFPLNMDFESKNCGACYAIGNEIVNDRKITGNYILGEFNFFDGKLKVCKQTYSNNTAHYCIKDMHGNSKLQHSSKNPKNIINQLEHEINTYNKYAEEYNKEACSHVIEVNKKIIECLESEILIFQ